MAVCRALYGWQKQRVRPPAIRSGCDNEGTNMAMAKRVKGEMCSCGGHAVTYQTDTIANFDFDEHFRGVNIAKYRF